MILLCNYLDFHKNTQCSNEADRFFILRPEFKTPRTPFLCFCNAHAMHYEFLNDLKEYDEVMEKEFLRHNKIKILK